MGRGYRLPNQPLSPRGSVPPSIPLPLCCKGMWVVVGLRHRSGGSCCARPIGPHRLKSSTSRTSTGVRKPKFHRKRDETNNRSCCQLDQPGGLPTGGAKSSYLNGKAKTAMLPQTDFFAFGAWVGCALGGLVGCVVPGCKKKTHTTPRDSQVVPHPSTKRAHLGLTSEFGTGSGVLPEVWSYA